MPLPVGGLPPTPVWPPPFGFSWPFQDPPSQSPFLPDQSCSRGSSSLPLLLPDQSCSLGSSSLALLLPDQPCSLGSSSLPFGSSLPCSSLPCSSFCSLSLSFQELPL